MQFNEYLKSCRVNCALTQEQLTQELYLYDIDNFEGLETTTISKWERGVTKPKVTRQLSILKYFQEKTDTALPCFDKYSVFEAEELICRIGMKNLLGKSKEVVLNFPSSMIGANDLHILELRNTDMIDRIIKMNVGLDKDFNHGFTELEFRHFKEWALYPDNSFFMCEYQNQFFGLLFTVRVKPKIFDKLISFEMEEKDLTTGDFASFDELGSNYFLSFFAMNEKASSLLFIRYYAHLIANQRMILDVGGATMVNDAKKLIENMCLSRQVNKKIEEGIKLQTYRETLPNFIACEGVLKMLFAKQECPEE